MSTAVVVALAPTQLRLGSAVWAADATRQLQAAWGVVGYLVAVVVVGMWSAERQLGRLALLYMTFCAVAGGLLLLQSLDSAIPFSRAIFLFAMGIGGVSSTLWLLVESLHGSLAAAPALAAAALIWQGVATSGSEDFSLDSHSYLLIVEVDRSPDLAVDARTEGGGLARLGDTLLVVTGRGQFAHVERVEGRLVAHPLDLPSPANTERFERESGEGILTDQFRVVDLFAEWSEDRAVVLVTHHVWYSDRRCYALRVSETDGSTALSDWTPWRVRFETSPCLTLDVTRRGVPFNGDAAGGRMVRVPQGVLLTVGDHLFDGLNALEAYPQDSLADYGKSILLLPDGTYRHFSVGHRNPQGLAVDATGRIWSTEHGPRGGDELNLLHDGGNYGWPWRTLGTEYGLRRWPLLRSPVDAWTEPVFAFVPSNGISNLIPAESPLFPDWQGNLLVGLLRNREILRLRLDGDRVAYVEELRLGHEVRDLEFDASGSVVLWTDEAAFVTIRPDTAVGTGESLAAQCTACHTLNPGQLGGLAPNLNGIVGQPVANAPYPYSNALLEVGGRWTPNRLDKFLTDPAAFAPGNAMAFGGISDPQLRRILIDYLREARR